MQKTELEIQLSLVDVQTESVVRRNLVAAPPSNRLRTPADLLHSHTWPIHSAAGLGCQSLAVPDMQARGAVSRHICMCGVGRS